MIAVIMCGGKGSRFITQDNIEKPLAHIRGQTLIETVLRAVILSGQFSRILCVSSPSSPHTTQLLEGKYRTVDKIEVMVAEGLGYSSDLSRALNSMRGQKVLTFPSDLALLNVVTVRKLVDKCTPSIHNTCIAAVAEKSFVSSVGLTCSSIVAIHSKEYCYTGVCGFNLGTSISEKPFKEFYSIVNEIQLVANINTATDLGLAEHLLLQLNQDCL
ncbi:MAG: NTP transferase domain-containing protein [Nitrososphaeraceae archaeon]